MKEDIALRKMEMLMRSINKARQEDDTLDELKVAAFEALLLNPGSEQGDWAKILIEQYGTEVVDSYGNDFFEVQQELADLWEAPYYDENSGLEYTFAEWALAFATDASVRMYYDLIDKIKTKKI